MTNKQALALGCGAVLLLVVAFLIAGVLFILHASKDVDGMAFGVQGPADVVVGQNFQVDVVVTNQRPAKPLLVSDVDLGEVYLEGFSIVSTTPPYKTSTHVPVDNSRSFNFDVTIPPGAHSNFTFTLRAEKPGLFRGDVDVCEGTRFTTGMAQTVVKEKP